MFRFFCRKMAFLITGQITVSYTVYRKKQNEVIKVQNSKCLNDIAPGQTATVKKLLSTGSIRRRLLDIGLIENTKVECVGRSPCGDPVAFLIRGAVIALRSEDCSNIIIT